MHATFHFQQSKSLNYTTAEAPNLAKMKSYFLAGVRTQVVWGFQVMLVLVNMQDSEPIVSCEIWCSSVIMWCYFYHSIRNVHLP